MPSLDKILRDGDDIIDSSIAELSKSIKASEPFIYKELIKLFDNVDITDGKLANTPKTQAFLLSLDKKIIKALKETNYGDSVLRYTLSFDKMAQNIIELQDAANGINIGIGQINPIKRIEVQNVIDKLTESGLYKDFIIPVRENLYRNIMTGTTVSEMEESLRKFVLSDKDGDAQLLRYVGQVSNDALRQFDGNVQANIGEELGLNAVRYVGSLIADSRAQCVKWASQNKGIIKVSDLQQEIDWALNKGTYKGKQVSGFNPNTTVKTFTILRGGFRCRHRAFMTNIE